MRSVLPFLLLLLFPLAFSSQQESNNDFKNWFNPLGFESINPGQTDKFLSGYSTDLSIFDKDKEAALEALKKLEMGPIDRAKLFFMTKNLTENISTVSVAFFNAAINEMDASETVFFAINCYEDPVLKPLVPYILNRKFAYTIGKSLLSAAHFLYECWSLGADDQFTVFGWDSLNWHTKMSVMYDLVGPQRKPILQILIEHNEFQLLANLPFLLESSLCVSRSLRNWLEAPQILLNPLFWINKDTRVEILQVFSIFPTLFDGSDDYGNSILIRAISQNCSLEVIEYIVKNCPYLKNTANNEGVCPLYVAYAGKNYAALELLARYRATAWIGRLESVYDSYQQCETDRLVPDGTVVGRAVADDNMIALKILVESNPAYASDESAYNVAMETLNIKAMSLFLAYSVDNVKDNAMEVQEEV